MYGTTGIALTTQDSHPLWSPVPSRQLTTTGECPLWKADCSELLYVTTGTRGRTTDHGTRTRQRPIRRLYVGRTRVGRAAALTPVVGLIDYRWNWRGMPEITHYPNERQTVRYYGDGRVVLRRPRLRTVLWPRSIIPHSEVVLSEWDVPLRLSPSGSWLVVGNQDHALPCQLRRLNESVVYRTSPILPGEHGESTDWFGWSTEGPGDERMCLLQMGLLAYGRCGDAFTEYRAHTPTRSASGGTLEHHLPHGPLVMMQNRTVGYISTDSPIGDEGLGWWVNIVRFAETAKRTRHRIPRQFADEHAVMEFCVDPGSGELVFLTRDGLLWSVQLDKLEDVRRWRRRANLSYYLGDLSKVNLFNVTFQNRPALVFSPKHDKLALGMRDRGIVVLDWDSRRRNQ